MFSLLHLNAVAMCAHTRAAHSACTTACWTPRREVFTLELLAWWPASHGDN